jgi:uncharacterized DUF497 family protein
MLDEISITRSMYNVSTMEEGGFEWDSYNIGHIKRHKVSPSEAEQVIGNDPIFQDGTPEITNGEERWTVYGQTNRQRYLTVVYTERGPWLRVVTAYTMDSQQRKYYLREKAKQSEKDDEYYTQDKDDSEENTGEASRGTTSKGKGKGNRR